MIANLFEQLAQLFILQDSFQKNLSNNEIINIIKLALINDSNAFKFNVNNLSIYQYFTIHFRTYDSLDSYLKIVL